MFVPCCRVNTDNVNDITSVRSYIPIFIGNTKTRQIDKPNNMANITGEPTGITDEIYCDYIGENKYTFNKL